MQALVHLGTSYETVLSAVVDKPWVLDGADEPDRVVVSRLHQISGYDEDAALRVIAMPFLETVEPGDGLALRWLAYLGASSTNVLNALLRKPWVEDGLNGPELGIVTNLRSISANDEDAALRVIAMPFLETIEPTDAAAVDALRRLALSSTTVFDALMDRAWVEGSIGETEISVIRDIGSITDNDEDTALRIIAMPFLEAIEPADGVTLGALRGLAFMGVLDVLVNRPWVEDGLSDPELRIVTDLRSISANDEDAALRVTGLPFLETIEPTDDDAVDALQRLVLSSTTVFDALMDRAWVEGSIGETEISVIRDVVWITEDDEDAALRIVAMPFLEAIEPADGVTLGALRGLASTGVLDVLVNRPWVGDGLSDPELRIVTDLRSIFGIDERAPLRIIGLPFLETIEATDAAAVDALRHLALSSTTVFDALMDRAWVEGSIGETEISVIRDIGSITDNDEDAALRVIGLPFLETIEPADGAAVDALRRLALSSTTVFDALMDRAWVEGSIGETEISVIRDVVWITEDDEDAALRVIAMPFLETIEPADGVTLGALRGLTSTGVLDVLLNRPWVGDGLSDPELRIVTDLRSIFGIDERAPLRIIGLPFLETVEPTDDDAVDALRRLALSSTTVFDALMDRAWVEGSIGETEISVIRDIGSITDDDEDTALRIIAMPFLEAIEPADGVTLGALRGLASTGVLDVLVNRPWVGDGLSDPELRIVTNLRSIFGIDERAPLRIIGLPFLETIEPTDDDAVDALGRLARSSTTVFDALMDRAWVEGSIGETEISVIGDIGWITDNDEDAALRVIGLPFLETIEPTDDDAVSVLRYLALSSTTVFDALMDRAWVEGSIGETEISVIRYIGWTTDNDEDAALRIIGLPLLETIEPTDDDAMYSLARVSLSSTTVFDALMDRAWVEGSIGETEISVLGDIGWITANDEDAALRIIAMPFLETIEPIDAAAMFSLRRVASKNLQILQQVMAHPSLSGGITDAWAKAVTAVGVVANINPDLIDVLLEPGGVVVEERPIDLPLAGEALLTIIGTGERPPSGMDALEHAVRSVENLMGMPFPTSSVILVLLHRAPAFNAGSSIVLPARADGSPVPGWFEGAIIHEVAHYYWRGNWGWINEGAASIIEDIVDEARDGKPVDADNFPCALADDIAELERLSLAGEPGIFGCNYTLGKRIFLDLYRTLGEEAFRRGFTNLYLMLEEGRLEISQVKDAFKAAAPEAAAVIDTIAARWYDGARTQGDPLTLDTGPVDPRVPSVNGRVNAATVLNQTDIPRSALSALGIDEGIWLDLHIVFQTHVAPHEVSLEIVGLYEDGFVFWRRSMTLELRPSDIGHRESVWLGVPRSYGWATGRYWVYVYHEGRKAAEVQFRVTE